MFETVVNEARLADQAREAIDTLSRVLRRRDLPAPIVHEILGSLAALNEAMPTVLELTAQSLVRSLDAYEVYQRDGGDPALSVMQAVEQMQGAQPLSTGLGQMLRAAQAPIAQQGYDARL